MLPIYGGEFRKGVYGFTVIMLYLFLYLVWSLIFSRSLICHYGFTADDLKHQTYPAPGALWPIRQPFKFGGDSLC